MAVLLGLDVGTSSTKALACDDRGRILATASSPHDLLQPRPGWTEQHPEAWWEAVTRSIRAVLPAERLREVRAVGLSGQMHGLVLLEARGAASGGEHAPALRPALLWNDQRTARQCEAIARSLGGLRECVRVTGNAPLPGFTLPKILWVRDEEPEVFAKAALALTPKDYIRFRLTGRAAIDVGDASGTLMMDLGSRAWSRLVAGALDLNPGLFPPIVESGDIAGHVTAYASRETGLPEGTPIIAGSGDNMMGAIGAGVVREGSMLLTIGTSGVVYAHTDAPRPDMGARPGRTHAMAAATGTRSAPRGWCVTGCTLSAGGALSWMREMLAPDVPYETLYHEASQAPPGCEGLCFLPYLTGERCPHPDPRARGAWIGLTSRHTRGHLVRAVLEGVALTLSQIKTIMDELGAAADQVRVGGGGAASPLWRQILADAIGQPLHLPDTHEGPALGAALLAGVACGAWPSVDAACASAIRIAEVTTPTTDDRLARAALIHRDLYADLSRHMAALSDLATRTLPARPPA